MSDNKKKDDSSIQLLDAALLKILDSIEDSEKKVDLIFQCKLPPRKFSVLSRPGKPKSLSRVSSQSNQSLRQATFLQFVSEVESIIGKDDMNAFETSGSVVAKVTASQLMEIVKLVGNIKDIRANRRFKGGIGVNPIKSKRAAN